MKKIAVDTVREFLKEYKNRSSCEFVKSYKINGADFEVHFHFDLSVDERDMFIQRVVSGSFDLAGRYHEELFQAMMHATVLQMCTNLPALALKGERMDDGQAILDLNQMDVLYHALNTKELPDEFHVFYSRMVENCKNAVADHKQYLRDNDSSSAAVRDLVFSFKDLVDKVSAFASAETFQDLIGTAQKMQVLSDSIHPEELENKIIELGQSGEEN